MKKIALTIAGLCIVLHLAGQYCGTAPPEISKNLTYELDPGLMPPVAPKKILKKVVRGRYAIFEIQFYLVRSKLAPEVLIYEDLQDATARLNSHFSGAGVTFKIGNIQEIEDDRLANFNPVLEPMLTRKKRGRKIIHVFLVNSLSDEEGNPLDGYTYHPDKEIPVDLKDIIVISRNNILDESTFSHEMGHFFGLQHTHEFEGTPRAELVSGQRCKELGDGICDTPASPNLIGWVDVNGHYTGRKIDREGYFYQPMVENIMSYAPPRFRHEFTAGQYLKIGQTALFKRSGLITGTTETRGAQLTQVYNLNLAAAFEQYKMGGPRQVILLVLKDSAMWSSRMTQELVRNIDTRSRYTNYFERNGEPCTLILYDADQPDEAIADFIGNTIFHQPNEMATREYEWLSFFLKHKLVPFPAMVVLQFTEVQEFEYQIKGIYTGYFKPGEIEKIPVPYPTTKPHTVHTNTYYPTSK